ncbi:unnamed protein product [Rotaria sordida]|uniref:MULE transposase domain-containing protein n=1 Tax=Rotaria sordida TaxID=392033 RepID=A0A813TA90_9BILA|nr:unnamed protein product [Rotaria sordida]
MSIITRSKSIALTEKVTSSPASTPIKYNHTKTRGRAQSRLTTYRSVSPSPINLQHNQLKPTTLKRSKTAVRTCSNSSSSSSSSPQSMSRSSSSSSTTSTDSISSDFNNLCLNNIYTSSTSISSSSTEINHQPLPSAIAVIKSIRSKDQLFMGGYTYQIKDIWKHEIRWTCKERRKKKSPCRTAINTTKNSATEQNPHYSFVRSNSVPHNHPPDEDSQVVLTFKSKLKEIGQVNRSAPPTKIYNKLATDMKLSDKQMGLLTRSEVLRQTIYNIRLKTTPPFPRDITFDIPPQFITTSADKNFLLYDHLYSKNTKRILIFTSEFLMRKMCSSTIDEATHSAQPVAWILLCDKYAQTYILVFKAMKKAASSLKLELKPERFITDFESGIITAVRKEFNGVIHQGCFFHFLQRVNKTLKSYGLWKYYKNNNSLHLYVKKLMAIVLLKANYMDNAYQLLCDEYRQMKKLKMYTNQMKRFICYYGRQWMRPLMRTMLTFHHAQFRTNNWNESYNSVFKCRAEKPHLSVWAMLDLLITEETSVRLSHHQSAAGKPKKIRRKCYDSTKSIGDQIDDINIKLDNDKITLNSALTSLGGLIGIKYDKYRI